MSYKCRFFKCEDSKKDRRVVNFMLPNQQPYKSNGKEIEWDTAMMVIFTDYAEGQKCRAGEVYAAADITMQPQNSCYMVRGKVYKVVDEDGLMVTDNEGSADYAEAIRLFDEFSGSGGMVKNSTSTNTPVAKVLTEIEKVKKDPRFKPPTVENDGFYVNPDLWYDLVMCARHKVPVLLLGPKGTGKTELIELVASKIGFGYDCFDMSIQNPYSYLCGNTRLSETGATTFQYARFADLIQDTNPTVICLDELSRCAPAASNILLPVLDRRRKLFVENAIDENRRVLNVSDSVVFWATANMGAEYLGVAGLDEALFDRFVVMETSYPPKKIEAKLLQARCGIDSTASLKLADFAEKVRNHKDISTKISTRKVLEIGRWVKWGYPLAEAINRVALSIWPDDENDGGERMSVKAVMQALN